MKKEAHLTYELIKSEKTTNIWQPINATSLWSETIFLNRYFGKNVVPKVGREHIHLWITALRKGPHIQWNPVTLPQYNLQKLKNGCNPLDPAQAPDRVYSELEARGSGWSRRSSRQAFGRGDLMPSLEYEVGRGSHRRVWSCSPLSLIAKTIK